MVRGCLRHERCYIGLHRRDSQRSWNVSSAFRVSFRLIRLTTGLTDESSFFLFCSKPLGIAELLPSFLSVISPDPAYPILSLHLQNLAYPQLLLELSVKFADDGDFVNNILSPALSLLLQAYWNGKKEDNQDLGGEGWRRSLAGLKKIAEVKELAGLVRGARSSFLVACLLICLDASIICSYPPYRSGCWRLQRRLKSSLCRCWVRLLD